MKIAPIYLHARVCANESDVQNSNSKISRQVNLNFKHIMCAVIDGQCMLSTLG